MIRFEVKRRSRGGASTAAVALLMLGWVCSGSLHATLAHADELAIDGVEKVRSLRLSADFADVELRATDGGFRGSWHAESLGEPRENQDAGIPVLPAAAPITLVNDGQLLVRAQNASYRYHLEFDIPRGWGVTVQIYRHGNVWIAGMEGAVSAWSAGGDVNVLQQTGAFSITAMDGSAAVDFVGNTLESASAISAHVPTLKERGIKLTIPPGLAAEFRISTTGRIHTDLPPLLHGLKQANAKGGLNPLSVMLNGGGPSISLRNVNGDVEILAHD
jgi:hypothetical protein